MKRKSQISLKLQTLHNEVTDSCTFCIVDYPSSTSEKFVLDSGFSSQDAKALQNNANFPFQPSELHFCIVSHNHFDHTRQLTFLLKEGFRSVIYTNEDTEKLVQISLPAAKAIVRKLSQKMNTEP